MANVKRVPVRSVQMKGYSHAGASHTKRNFKGFVVSSGPPALRRQRTNIIGAGLRLKSTIDREALGISQEQADAWQKRTEAEFALWALRKQACDATGVNNFYGMQQLVALSWPMSGDVFALIKRADTTTLMPYSLRLHILEADRVRTPTDQTVSRVYPMGIGMTTLKLNNGNTIHDGVEVDKSGAVVAYHIASTHPNQLDGTPTTFTRVEAYGELTGLPNILHIMDSERPEQYRGVPYLAQAIEPLLQMRRYTEAEITAALVQSFFTAFITTEGAANGDLPIGESIPEGEQEVSRDPNEIEMGMGNVNFLEPGESVQALQPTHPHSGFDVFMRALCEQVGACLEIPADLLLMSFNSSYSASRAALLEAWKAFKMRREWLTDDFCRPVYEIWLTEAVARGRISAPGFLTDPIIRQAYLGSEWIGPSQGQLDPTKEVQAAVTAIENGLSTREAEAVKLNGSEFARNADKLAIENERLRAANGGNNPIPAPPDTGSGETEEENAETEK